MRVTARLIAAGIIVIAGAAIAKEGVTNPAVKARQDLMDTIAGNAKILGDMAGDKVAFDAAAAEAAKTAIVTAASAAPGLFEAPETDPKSEAKPEIWTNWADFTAKAEALGSAAMAMDASSVDGVKAGMGAIGGTCGACHKAYRL